MSEPLSTEIEAIRARHPEATPTAAAMLDAAVLHQRIAELEAELAALKAADEQRFSKALDVADEDWQADNREIYDLKIQRDAWRQCAERLVREIVPFSEDFHGRYGYEHCNAKEALAEFDNLQALHP